MKIRDLMTKQVATVRATDSTAVAARVMWDCDCGAVPVLDSDGRAIAMITDRDICMAALMGDRAPSAIPVSEAMSRDPAVLRPGRRRLHRGGHHARLPNQANPDRRQDRRPVGVLSLADIVRATERKKGRTTKRSRPPRSPARSPTSARRLRATGSRVRAPPEHSPSLAVILVVLARAVPMLEACRESCSGSSSSRPSSDSGG